MGDIEQEFRHLRWRARRGMLELDLLLVPFFDEAFATLSPERQAAFVRLLEQDDPDLALWFSRKARPAEADLADLVDFILARVQPD